jgi:hypothetical protein
MMQPFTNLSSASARDPRQTGTRCNSGVEGWRHEPEPQALVINELGFPLGDPSGGLGSHMTGTHATRENRTGRGQARPEPEPRIQ